MNPVDPHQQTLALFAGIGIVLVLASTIGRVLKGAVARNRPHGIIDNLNARIKAWWVIVAVSAIAFLLAPIGILLLFMFVSFVALREFTQSGATGGTLPPATMAIGAVPLLIQYLLVYLGWAGLYVTLIPLLAVIPLPGQTAADGHGAIAPGQVLRMRWGLVLCVYCISYVPALLTLDIPGYEGRNVLLIVFLIVVVQSSDVLQYVWGMLVGRRKVAPAVSPSKTWEGLLGGVASSTALGAALYGITPFSPWQAAAMALAINAMGAFGGLVFSAIKRERGIKDWSRLIDGHGGMLDRLDSVALSAPVFYCLTRFGWA
jgi:phosphatidate cytidylyltransferase